MFSPLEQFDVKPLIFITLGGYDLTFFDIFIPLILTIIFLGYVSILKFYYRLIPYCSQYVLEGIVEFVYSIIKTQIGGKAYSYINLILSIFLCVLFGNLLSIFPFGISLTSHLIILLWFSLGLGLGIFILGLWVKGLKFLKIFVPTCPIALLPVLILIELFSYVIRCFSLAIRLAANMLAGHTLLAIIALFILNIVIVNYMIAALGFITILSILLLEVGVCCLQAYVMAILACIYLNDVYNEGGH